MAGEEGRGPVRTVIRLWIANANVIGTFTGRGDYIYFREALPEQGDHNGHGGIPWWVWLLWPWVSRQVLSWSIKKEGPPMPSWSLELEVSMG